MWLNRNHCPVIILLLTLSNITVTPHIAASTVETRDAMAKLAAANILAGLAGDPLPAQVQIKD